MKFCVSNTPNPSRWPVGVLLGVKETAEMMEENAKELFMRSRRASAFMGQGFRFHVIHEEGDWRPAWEDEEDIKNPI